MATSLRPPLSAESLELLPQAEHVRMMLGIDVSQFDQMRLDVRYLFTEIRSRWCLLFLKCSELSSKAL